MLSPTDIVIGSSTDAETQHVHRGDRDLDRVQRSGDIPGLVADFDDNGREIRARDGVARLGGKQKMPWNGEFRIASTTKTFVATVALQLVDEGKLSLDDTVEKWLPGLIKGNGNDGSKITVRELLGQTSGLYNYLEDPDLLGDLAQNIDKYRYDVTPPEEWVRIAMKHRPEFAPGTQWKYSNTNYVVAAMIIQRVTGQPWDVEVEHRIIAPLSLRHTYSTGGNPSRPADDQDFPGGRYGLGLRWMPLSCGGGYWHHEGDHPGGFHTRTGVTADGRRSIVISTTSGPGATTSAALNKLVDDAFCGR